MFGRGAFTAVAIIAVFVVLSGIAGITVGGTSAAAGWWLVVVGILAILAILIQDRGRRAS
jgi:uncharacterized membrane protein HdeD (DUF308 family)